MALGEDASFINSDGFERTETQSSIHTRLLWSTLVISDVLENTSLGKPTTVFDDSWSVWETHQPGSGQRMDSYPAAVFTRYAAAQAVMGLKRSLHSSSFQSSSSGYQPPSDPLSLRLGCFVSCRKSLISLTPIQGYRCCISCLRA